MNNLILTASIIGLLSLAACDKPTVVTVPAETIVVPVPGPAGPAGATGETGQSGDIGAQGKTGETGETGGDTTVIITPPQVEATPEKPAE